MNASIYFYLIILNLTETFSFFNISSIKPTEMAIIQFDSRPLDNYWLEAARWNSIYAKRHHHHYFLYSSTGPCKYMEEKLADAWCKVKAMIQAMTDHPSLSLFLYLDSDAVIDEANKHLSLSTYLTSMQERLQWNPSDKPLVFNQDGPCWWCALVAKVGYKMCLNAGTVMWIRDSRGLSLSLLEDWWHSTMDSYAYNPLNRKFRLNWPWEQDRQMALYNRSSLHIQITSHPHLSKMPRERGKLRIKDWCFSHLPEAGCFISHYCANANSKQKMRELYHKLTAEAIDAGYSDSFPTILLR